MSRSDQGAEPAALASELLPSGAVRTALPPEWEALWGHPDDKPARIEWHQLKRLSGRLASEVELVDTEHLFGSLVGSDDLRRKPVHRWFTYKEGFSPELLDRVLAKLGLNDAPIRVADCFGGVATTALAGIVHPVVSEVRSVEYSPFARFVGETKLLWPSFDSERLADLLPAALDYDPHRRVAVPDLAAFSNPEIFSSSRIRSLLAVREHLRALDVADAAEKDFFLLGLAAVIEDLSGAMKDGRALRIKRERSRRASSLAATEPLVAASGTVKRALAGQWSAMIADLAALKSERHAAMETPAYHVAGDARHLNDVLLQTDEPAFTDEWAHLSVFSPPYLNCIDYTELYKLELWLMEHVADQSAFRQTRLGTLRSHPSVRFEERPYLEGVDGDVIELVQGLSHWMSAHGTRREIGPVVRQYFEDMLQVWREQLRILDRRGVAVCVVANSTFSRRDRGPDGSRRERWRLPVLTDVILAHLALLAGFDSVQIWQARELRPRNVRAGQARESLVVASKG